MTDATTVLTAAVTVAEGEFRIGRVFARTAALLLRNLPVYCVVTGIAAVPSVLLAEGVKPSGVAGAVWPVLVLVLVLALGTLSQAIVVHGAFQDMRGRPVMLLDALHLAFGRLLPIIGLAICTSLAVGIGFLLLIVPGLILLTMWFVATPACVVEQLGVFDSMARSSALTKGHRWQIFGMMALIAIAESIGGAGLKAVLGLTASAGLVIAGTLIWTGLSSAFGAIFAVVTYHDLRVAKEGIDTQRIAAVFD